VATITSAQSGNFSDTATWVGGVVPGVGDVAVAATGHVIVIDVDVTVDQVTTTGGTFTFADGVSLTATNATAGVLGGATGIGAVTMDLNAPDSATIIGNVRAGGIASSWGVEFTGTGSLTINGEVRGGTFAGAAATGANGAQLTGAGTLTVDNGTDTAVRGGSSGFAVGIQCTANATITITGNITGGGFAAVGLTNSGSATITIIGNVFGGLGSQFAHGLLNSGSAIINVIGDLTGGSGQSNIRGIENTGSAIITITGNITGGSFAGAVGLNNTAAATITITGNITGGIDTGLNNTAVSAVISVTGELIPSTGANALNSSSVTNLLTGPFRVAANGRHAVRADGWQWLNVSIPGEFEVKTQDLTETRTLFTADVLPGVPAATDVRSGVTYGPLGEITGTCAVPPPTAVASGVPVDATTGEAVLRQADAAAIFGAIWEQG
jgi:hypothetical protein